MEVMDLFDFFDLNAVFEAFDDINLRRSGFHQHDNAVLEDRNRSEDHKDGEDESRNGVCYFPLGLYVDDGCCADYSCTLDHISNDVYYCCSDIHVFMAVPVSMTMRMLFSSFTFVVVIMSVVMVMVMGMSMFVIMFLMNMFMLMFMLMFVLMFVLVFMFVFMFMTVIVTMIMIVIVLMSVFMFMLMLMSMLVFVGMLMVVFMIMMIVSMFVVMMSMLMV